MMCPVYRVVEELAPRHIWDVEIHAGSSPVYPTKIFLVQVVFFGLYDYLYKKKEENERKRTASFRECKNNG